MKSRKSLTMVWAVLMMALILPAAAMAQPAVSVECAYNAPGSTTDLDCQVWVNSAEALRSGGVQVTYDNTKLTAVSATKDPAWVFTDGITTHGYMDPEIDAGAGTVVFIVGMLNTSNTALGIPAGRSKVGNIVFTRSDTPTAGNGAAQAGFFGISATYGRGGSYVNFVSAAGAELDSGAEFTSIVAERGDANADGLFNVSDYGIVRLNVLNNPHNFPPYADCTGDGTLNVSDYGCIRLKAIR